MKNLKKLLDSVTCLIAFLIVLIHATLKKVKEKGILTWTPIEVKLMPDFKLVPKLKLIKVIFCY